MIGFFPDPYPDELLYSVYARYSDQIGYLGSSRIMQELLGYWGAKATIDLPRHLNHLVSILPLGHRYTVEGLINNHTLLPFYAPFLPLERVNSIQENMKGSNKRGIHQTSGVAPSTIHSPNWLRFCPMCVEEDRKRFGETYWHRLHQLPGVEACPKHTVFLEDSNVAAPIHNRKLASAEQAIQMASTHSLDLSVPCHTALLQIAHNAAWLLSQNNLIPGFQALKERYLNLLLECGFAAYSGRIHIKKLKRAFNEYYSPRLLKLLQCEVDENKDSNWLSRIGKDLSKNQAHHPLRHLLLIQFLECTLEEFFIFNKPIQPFGERPWPCLNKASDHFHQPVIEECKITRNGWQPERPIGIFSCCNCGFTYTRKGPDLSVEDRFRITRTKSYGVDWEARDAQLAELVVLSASRLKSVLGRPVRVTKQAIAIELEQKALFQKNLHKLPLTAEILAEVVETREDCAVRRVQWAAECFRQQNINPAWSQLIMLAGVYELREVPQVKEAIDAALQSLESLSALDRWRRG